MSALAALEQQIGRDQYYALETIERVAECRAELKEAVGPCHPAVSEAAPQGNRRRHRPPARFLPIT